MKLYFHFLTGLLTQNPVNDNKKKDKAAEDAMTRSDLSRQLQEDHKKHTQFREETQAREDWERILERDVSGDIFREVGDS